MINRIRQYLPKGNDGYNYSVSEHPGTVERLHYTTDAYEDGVTYEKYVTVYLPADPGKKILFEKQENVYHKR